MSIVIVEGVDGSGKTTLLRNLRQQSKTYFWIASSSGRPKTVEELNEAMHLIGQCAYLKLPVICDRLPIISEQVYGPVIRGVNLLDQLGRREQGQYATLLSEEIERVIYCRPPLQQIKDNLKSYPQIPGIFESLAVLVQRYDDFMESLRDDNIFVYHYDYTKNHAPLDGIFFGRV